MIAFLLMILITVICIGGCILSDYLKQAAKQLTLIEGILHREERRQTAKR